MAGRGILLSPPPARRTVAGGGAGRCEHVASQLPAAYHDGGEGDLTYNFDVDQWFERQRQRLLARRQVGELDDRGLTEGLEQLEKDMDVMLARLDGSFQVGPLAGRGEPK